MRFLAIWSVCAVAAVLAPRARAQAPVDTQSVCNATSHWAYIAVVHKEQPGSKWRARGWYRVGPGQCHDFKRYKGSHFYYRANLDASIESESASWGADRAFCISDNALDVAFEKMEELCAEVGSATRDFVDMKPERCCTENFYIEELLELRIAARLGAERMLTTLGYDVGPVDAVVDQPLIDAIRDFRAKNDLPVVGRVDADLLSALHLKVVPIVEERKAAARRAEEARRAAIAQQEADARRRSEDLAWQRAARQARAEERAWEEERRREDEARYQRQREFYSDLGRAIAGVYTERETRSSAPTRYPDPPQVSRTPAPSTYAPYDCIRIVAPTRTSAQELHNQCPFAIEAHWRDSGGGSSSWTIPQGGVYRGGSTAVRALACRENDWLNWSTGECR